jgi:hypothetical protein
MSRFTKLTSILLLVAALVSACGPAPTEAPAAVAEPTATAAPAPTSEPAAPAEPAASAAPAGGQISVYISPDSLGTALEEAFRPNTAM